MADGVVPSATAVKEAPPARDTPGRLAARRFWRGAGTRVGAGLLALMVLVGIYAPFLAGEVALVWRDADGLGFPVLADLFNRNSYGKPHDLLFNIAALLLPPVLVGWFLLRRRWSARRRLGWALGLLIGCWLLSMLPLFPGHDRLAPLWRQRASQAQTYRQHIAAPQGAWAIYPLVPHRPDTPFAGVGLKPPLTLNPATGHRFWLGTDPVGKDVLAYMAFGVRISLTIGLFATGLSMAIGVLIGAISAYFGGRVDLVLQRLVEIMMCFPTFILVLVVVAMTSRDIFIIMLVLGLTGWADVARLVRGEFLAQVVRDYVVAGESLGLSKPRIMFRHILPNTLTPLIITATFGVAGSVGLESGLAFIGMGDVNASSWGLLLNQGKDAIEYGWLIYVPGLAIFALVSALNLIGEGLREALDPKGTR